MTTMTAGNIKVSWFIGGDANDQDPQMILIGDCNVGPAPSVGAPASTHQTIATTFGNGATLNAAATPISWTIDTHNKVGNLGLSDGSVQQVSISGIKTSFQNGTNTVVFPAFNFFGQ